MGSTKSTGEAETSPNMEGGEEVLLEGCFLIGLGRREVEGKVILTPSHIAISLAATNCFARGGSELELKLADVIGVRAEKSNRSLSKGSLDSLCIFWYPRQESALAETRVTRRPVVLKMIDPKTVTTWQQAISSLLRTNNASTPTSMCPENTRQQQLETDFDPKTSRERPILFLINPKSGSGRALNVFNSQVLPILNESGIAYEMELTNRANHGRELVATSKLDRWRAIVTISGDGLFHEVLNGIFERDDWLEACKLPLGVIPGGTGNGLARTIQFENNESEEDSLVRQATLRAIRCTTTPMDLVCVQLAGGSIYSFLSAGWGFISDVDIESEKLRWMGDTRFSLWSAYALANLKLYRGRLSYLQAEGFQPISGRKKGAFLRRSTSVQAGQTRRQEEPWRQRFHSTGESSYLSSPEEERLSRSPLEEVKTLRSPLEEVKTLRSPLEEVEESSEWPTAGSDCSGEEQARVHTPDLGLPGLEDPVPPSWTTIEDDFVLIYVVKQSYIASGIFFSPWSKLNDEVMFLFTIRRGSFPNRKVQKSTIAQFLLKMESGEHIHLPGVEMIPVRAFRITPLEDRGLMTVDGESVPRGVMQASVLPAMVKVIS